MSLRIASEPSLADTSTAVIQVGRLMHALPRQTDRGTPLTITLASGLENYPEIRGYRILNKLGRGGMGIVYKAVHLPLNRVVALKILSGAPGQIDPEVRTRFRKEAEALASLRHPNIVPVFEVGEADGVPFFTMEFVEGGDLARRILERSPAPLEAAGIVAQLARGMESAHAAGILHRDLKPSNVLMSLDSQASGCGDRIEASRSVDNAIPKIADFGLAKRFGLGTGNDRTVTQAGDILGTPSYMAPEQAEGHGSAAIGPHTDIHALGAILYELITRQPPFDAGDAVKTVIQVINEDPVSPSKLVHGIPRDLQTICLKCLQKDPKKRYESAAALADDLDRFAAGRPIDARPASAIERVCKWARRRPALAGMIATTAFALLAGFVGITTMWMRANERAASETTAHELAEARKQQLEAQTLIMESQLARSYVDRGIADCRTDDVPRGMILLARSLVMIEALRAKLPQGAEQDRLGHLEWVVRTNLSAWQTRIPFRVRARFNTINPGGDRWVLDVDLSPDGRRVLTGSKDGYLRLFDAVTSAEIGTPVKLDGPVVGTMFSADGKRFLVARVDLEHKQTLVQLWDTEKRETIGPAIALATYVVLKDVLEFSNAGFVSTDVIAVQKSPKTIRFYKAGTDQEVRPAIESTVPITLCLPVADGAIIFTGHRDGSVRKWDGRTGTELAHTAGHPSVVATMAASPDGTKILAGHWMGTVQVFEQESLKPTCPPIETSAVVDAVGQWHGFLRTADFSPDSREIVTGGGLMNKSLVLKGFLQTWNAETGTERYRYEQPLPAWGAAFSGDGSQVVSVAEDCTIRVFNAFDGSPTNVYSQRGNPAKVLIGRDGRALLTADLGSDAAPTLADLGPSTQAHPALHAAGPILALKFKADGRLHVFTKEHVLRTYDPALGKEIEPALSLPATWDSVMFSPDGLTMLACDFVPYEPAEIPHAAWDLVYGRQLWQQSTLPAGSTALLPDRDCLLFPYWNDQLKRLDPDGKTRWEFTVPDRKKGSYPVIGVVTPDASTALAVTSMTNRAYIIDVQTGKQVGSSWELPGRVTSACAHPNGREVIFAFGDGFIQSFDLTTRKIAGAAIPARGDASQMEMSPDGRMLCVLTNRSDKQALNRYDPRTGLSLGPTEFFTKENEVRRMAFHPNSRVLATGDALGVVRFWDMPVELKGSAEQVRCWTEMTARTEWVAEPTETMRNLDDEDVGIRRKRLERVNASQLAK